MSYIVDELNTYSYQQIFSLANKYRLDINNPDLINNLANIIANDNTYNKCSNDVELLTQEEWDETCQKDIVIKFLNPSNIQLTPETVCYNYNETMKWLNMPENKFFKWVPNNLTRPMDDMGYGGGKSFTTKYYKLPSNHFITEHSIEEISKKGEFVGLPVAVNERVGREFGISANHGQLPGFTIFKIMRHASRQEILKIVQTLASRVRADDYNSNGQRLEPPIDVPPQAQIAPPPQVPFGTPILQAQVPFGTVLNINEEPSDDDTETNPFGQMASETNTSASSSDVDILTDKKITSIAMYEDSDDSEIYVASGNDDYTISIWKVSTKQEIRKFVGHTKHISSIVAYATFDNIYIVSGSHDKTIRVWDAHTGLEVKKFTGHEDKVSSVDVYEDYTDHNMYIVSGSYDKTVRIWSFSTGQEIKKFLGHTDKINSVAVDVGIRTTIISGADDSTVRIWSIAIGQVKKINISNQGRSRRALSVAFAHNSDGIVVGSSDNTVNRYDLNSLNRTNRYFGNGGIDNVAVYRDNIERKYYVIANSTFSVYIWSLSSAQLMRQYDASKITSIATYNNYEDKLYIAYADDIGIHLKRP